NHNIGLLFCFCPFVEALDQIFYRHLSFWDQRSSSPASDTCINGNKTCIPTHYFHKKQAVVGRCCITDLVNSLNGCIAGRIKAYGSIGPGKVVINGSRNSYGRNTKFLKQQMGPCQGTISSDYYQGINTMFL